MRILLGGVLARAAVENGGHVQIATVTLGGESVTWIDGEFAVEGQSISIADLLGYDRLGLLTWESGDTREWAYDVGRSTTAPQEQPIQYAAASERGKLQPLPRLNKPRWVPTFIMLGVLVAWAILIRVTGLVDSGSDITSLGAIVLLGIFGFVAIPALVAQFSPRAPKQGIRVTTWILYAIIGILLAFPVASVVRDVLHPVVARTYGEVPNLTAIVGQEEHDAERVLNDFEQGNTTEVFTAWSRIVDYTLPDVEVLPNSPLELPLGLQLMYREGTKVTCVYLVTRADSPIVEYPAVDFPSGMLRRFGISADGIAGPFPVYDTGILSWIGTAGENEWEVTLLLMQGPAPSIVTLAFGPGVIPDDFRPLLASAMSGAAPAQPTDPATEDNVSTGASSVPEETSDSVLSSSAIQYARNLGGKLHRDETLYFIIGASATSESLAQKRLADALPMFGDMQSYFIVQKSDNFDGMEPGWFVVIEAYRTETEARDNLDFAKRGFEDGNGSPYIKRATVRTDDPIPVNYVDVNPSGD